MPDSFRFPQFPPLPPSPLVEEVAKPSTGRPGNWGLLGWLVALPLISMATALGLGLHVLQEPAPPPATIATVAHAPRPSPAAVGLSEGKPWGQIECVPITIAPPLEFVAQFAPSTAPIVWHVPNVDAKQLALAFSEIGLDTATRDKLMTIAEASGSIHGMFLHPSRELILGLSPDARAKLYVYLSSFSQNVDQIHAFRFASQSPDEWLAPGSLPREVDAMVRRLVYRHGRFLFFADLRTIASDLPSAEVRARLIQTLARKKTFLAKMRVTRTDNLKELLSYWGRGGRAKEIQPFFESLAGPDGEQALDIVHLLPPFARRHLYTYPQPDKTAEAGKRDCHWTTFNFFAEVPDDRFSQAQEVLATLERDYKQIDGVPRFGDVVMLLVNGSEAIHTAVYLADDILFTKNGSSSLEPWILMKLDDLQDFYPTHRPVEIRFYRRLDRT